MHKEMFHGSVFTYFGDVRPSDAGSFDLALTVTASNFELL